MASIQEVTEVFITLFNRVIDSKTADHWKGQGDYGVDFINKILETPEASSFKTLSTQNLVEKVYENALGKFYADDPEGVRWWVSAINEHKWSQADFIIRFIDIIAQHRSGTITSNDAEKNAVLLFNTKIALTMTAAESIKHEVTDLKSLTFGSGLSELKASNITSTLSIIQAEIKKIAEGGSNNDSNNNNNSNQENNNDSKSSDPNPDPNNTQPNEPEVSGVHPGTDFGTIA